MNVADSKLNIEDIESYLFLEMSDDERLAFERELFENDELFFEVEEHENHLVDLYAHGKLPPNIKSRFERSLADLPARREKVANAVALKTYIEEERLADSPVSEPTRETFAQKLTKLFSFGSPVAVLTMA